MNDPFILDDQPDVPDGEITNKEMTERLAEIEDNLSFHWEQVEDLIAEFEELASIWKKRQRNDY